MPPSSRCDESAATWDDNPPHIALMRAIGSASLREARPTKATDVRDCGCGIGLASFLLHQAARAARVLSAFHGLLHPGGILCIADSEPGRFHDARAAAVYPHGFGREDRGRLARQRAVGLHHRA